MSVAGEEIVVKITVDGNAAQAELKAVGATARSLGGAYNDLTKSMRELEVASTGYAAKAEETASITSRLAGGAKEFHKVMGPLTGSVMAVTAALGDQGGTAGRALLAVNQLANAWATGGPMAVGMAAASIAVVELNKHWDDLIKKQNEAIDAMYSDSDRETAALNKLRVDNAGLRRSALSSTSQITHDIDSQIDAIRNKIKNDWTLSVSEGLGVANKELNILHATIEALQDKRELLIEGVKPTTTVAEAEDPAMKRYHDQISAMLKAKGDADKELARSTFETQKEIDDATDAAYKARLDKRAADEQALIEQSSAVYEQQLEGQKEADALADEEYEAHIQRDIAAQKRLSDAMAELAQTSADAVEGGISTATSAFAGYFAMRAAGEKYAAEKSTAAFMSGIGQQLVGIGLKSEFSGAAKLFDPVTLPIGIAEMAFGAGAIGVGIALGAKGAGISASVATKEKADEKQAKGADAGARGRSGGSIGSGGNGSGRGFTVNNYYGVGGPQADDNARRMRDLLRLAARRGFT